MYSTPKRTLNEPNTSYTGNGKIAFEPRGDQNEPNSSACARTTTTTTTTTCRAASRRAKQRTPPPKHIIISLGGIATAGRQMCAYYARPTTQPHHAQPRVHGMKQWIGADRIGKERNAIYAKEGTKQSKQQQQTHLPASFSVRDQSGFPILTPEELLFSASRCTG